MSFGRGTSPDIGYGEADSWGGPENGVDIQAGLGGVEAKASARISQDTYTFLVIAGALVVLWTLGGTVFRKVRI
jgi:hypothetical protein